ncbi:MAG: cytochrome c biogenesis protein CcdA, partial [Bacteroidota bacterium]
QKEEAPNTSLAEEIPSVLPEPPSTNLIEGSKDEPIQEAGNLAEKPISTQSGGSLWKLMLEGFLFGFASILTPCIFPMIPLTVSYFTKRKENKGRGIRDAVFYGLSIIAIYTGLALVLSAIFGPDTMQRVAIHPAFNLAFFGLLVVFALSFMGMFELTLPSSWSTAASKGSERGGLGGIFLMALALAIVSFSCTGPIVATALGDAFANGNYLAPTMTMLSFSTAMALPFVLFAIFPGWLESLPKSGGWLNAVKVTLGLLELALAFIYLSRADLVMHWGLLSREAFIGAWVVIFGVLGFYLLGKLQFPHDSKVERLPVSRALLGMGSLWFVLYLIPGLWGAPLNLLGGYLPPNNENTGVLLQEGQAVAGVSEYANEICTYPGKKFEHLAESTPRGFCAFYDLDQAMAYAQAQNKPLFLDFTGHTCANCRYLEQNAWIDSEIQSFINQEYVLVSLYTDDRQKLAQTEVTPEGKKLRTIGDKWLQYQIDTYTSNAQPFYVLLDHEGRALLPPIGYNPPLDLQEYRDYFQKGLERFEGKDIVSL